ncbi:uncharacterized protein MONBRDRAFT_33735 [Monosiga brevicollis MX1]|uniref:Enoyl-CoA hydratase n=1 Tax=Monosiga brevicollis TaxID=81824 RepID=A9V763_MONBE|nr:uncharacterized protein MONBRDRAFT_33735 [Monosiga brevicollis MX1]EDQ86736.1 predicted protein [Monosiga brevicollis MX1]|eukprot:XP_001748572.1 hypothetical protein [Monosiga brevicollis MX1]
MAMTLTAAARCVRAARLVTPCARSVRGLQHASGEGVEVHVDDQGFANVTLARGDKFNTFSDKVISRLDQVWNDLRAESGLRGMFLRAEGRFFSAGADLKWMKGSINYSKEQNQADAEALSNMLLNLNTLPMATIALVQGPAFGGGVGLVSCCDVAVATQSANFTLSEVKLGIIPATISPYVIARIGAAQSRRYMLTAEAISSTRAQEIGLVHEVVADEEGLREMETSLRQALLRAGPNAVAASKHLVTLVEQSENPSDLVVATARALAEQRASEEGQAGLGAFFARKPAPWVPEDLA